MTEELGVLALLVVVLGVITYPFFNFESASFDRNAAQRWLDNWVQQDLETLCQGPSTDWTYMPMNMEIDDNIKEIKIWQSEDTFNATLRGDAGTVKRKWEHCNDIIICAPGEDASNSNPTGCSDGGYIPAEGADWTPTVDVWFHANNGEITLDPAT